jgi:hypothetical protein
MQRSASEKKRPPQSLRDEIFKASNNCSKLWSEILKKVPKIKEQADGGVQCQNWYKNLKYKRVHTKILINPTVNNLMNEEVESKHRRAMADAIENHVDASTITYYAEKKLKETIAEISDYKNYEDAHEKI